MCTGLLDQKEFSDFLRGWQTDHEVFLDNCFNLPSNQMFLDVAVNLSDVYTVGFESNNISVHTIYPQNLSSHNPFSHKQILIFLLLRK